MKTILTPSILKAMLGTVLLAGCAVAAEAPETQGDSTSAIVSNSTFARAMTIVRGVDYLSFGYKEDGCYARALYMSAELAAQGIESNSIYAIASDDDHPLHIPRTSETWIYHVAPMLNVATPGQPVQARVLDPSMASVPLPSDLWVFDMGYTAKDEGTPKLRAIAGSTYIRMQSDFDDLDATDVWNDVPNFDAMPNFKASDLQSACETMHAYLELEGDSPALQAKKQAKLVARTPQLLARLAAEGKLDGAASDFDAERCSSCRPGAQGEDVVVCAN